VTIACVVEGHAEVDAVPLLLRRIKGVVAPNRTLRLPPPIRIPGTRLRKQEGLRKAVSLASKRTREEDAILVLMDAEDDCPAEEAPDLLQEAHQIRPDRRTCVVLAKHEYEAWFLAAAASLRGKRGFAPDAEAPQAPEDIRGAKEWMSARMKRPYSETIDQPGFTGHFDLDRARAADSFDKLYREMETLLTRPTQP